jgi:CheY-specific phosphatase CheX
VKTPENAKFQELAKQYHLDPIPESVAQLTDLVARQESDLDMVAKIITKDPALTARLLRAANPRAKSEEDYDITTVDDALMRIGIGCVLLLAMGSPLSLALVKTFQTMLEMKLESVNPKASAPFLGEHILGTISFAGKAEGRVYLRLSLDGGRLIASRILGLTMDELTNSADITDAVGELLNIVTGNFKSNLCDAGLDCKLQTPSVTRTDDFAVRAMSGGGSERMAFRTPQLLVYMDITVNPFNDD